MKLAVALGLAIASLSAGCQAATPTNQSQAEASTVELGEPACDVRLDQALASPGVHLACIEGPNGTVSAILFVPETEPTSIMLLDVGGPGYDVDVLKSRPASFELPGTSQLVVVLEESWQRFEANRACLDALEDLLDDVRRLTRNHSSAETIASRCVPDSTFSSDIVTTVRSLREELPGLPTGLVAASFGAQRASALPDTTKNELAWVILDSPVLAVPGEGLLGRVASTSQDVLASMMGCRQVDCAEELTRLEQTYETPESVIALLALAGAPGSNVEYTANFLRGTASPESVAQTAGAFLRARFGTQYQPSWFGYWAELCPLLGDSDQEILGEDSSNSVEQLYRLLHQPCLFITEAGSRAGGAFATPVCLIIGTVDPVSPEVVKDHPYIPVKVDVIRREQPGHLPLLLLEEQVLALTNFTLNPTNGCAS